MNVNEYKFFIAPNSEMVEKVRAIIRGDYPSFEDKMDDLSDLGIISQTMVDDLLNPRYREEIELYDYLVQQYG